MASPSGLKASSTFFWNSCAAFDAVTVVVLEDDDDDDPLPPLLKEATRPIRAAATSSGPITAAATLSPWFEERRGLGAPVRRLRWEAARPPLRGATGDGSPYSGLGSSARVTPTAISRASCRCIPAGG